MPGPNVALSECQIDVLAIDGRSVEIVRAAPEIREFPARVSEGLGICLKLGDAHDVMINGRRATYPAGSVSVRVPGCVWASDVGCHGFVSVDVDAALLPVEFSGPHAYLTMLRANRAKALLTTGACPAEAALAAGFADKSHLGLWFRRIFGTTPAAYRQMVAGAIS